MSGNNGDAYRFRWNSASANMFATFHRMFIDQRYVDVTLSCDGQLFHCHRIVLSAYSSVFDDILRCENVGDSIRFRPIIILQPEVKIFQIATLLEFMYRGEVSVPQSHFAEVLKAAELLQIRGLAGVYGSELYNRTINAPGNTHEQQQNSINENSNEIGSETTDSFPDTSDTSHSSLVRDKNHKVTKSLSSDEISSLLENRSTSVFPIGEKSSISTTFETREQQRISIDENSNGIGSETTYSFPDILEIVHKSFVEQGTREVFLNNTIPVVSPIGESSYSKASTGPDATSAINDRNNVRESLSAPPAISRKRKSPAEMQEAAQRVLRGMDIEVVCKELDVNKLSLRLHMKRNGYIPTDRRRKSSRYKHSAKRQNST